MASIAITWKKSAIGYAPDQRRTVAGLGLRRLNQTVIHEDTPSIRGMVNKIIHLVEVSEVTAKATGPRKGRARKTE